MTDFKPGPRVVGSDSRVVGSDLGSGPPYLPNAWSYEAENGMDRLRGSKIGGMV